MIRRSCLCLTLGRILADELRFLERCLTCRRMLGVHVWESTEKVLTLLDEILLVVDDSDILLCEVADSFVLDFPEIFGDLRYEP